MTDLGNGQVSLDARGEFYSSSLGVLSGGTLITPTVFAGKNMRFSTSAASLLGGGDVNIVGPNGQIATFGVEAQESCGLKTRELLAVPFPDGNSRVELDLSLGPEYDDRPERDGAPRPLVLIGTKVFGLRETPFEGNGGSCVRDAETVCKYRFIAPTADIRNAQSFLVRDLRWQHMVDGGTVRFAPSFGTVTVAIPGGADGPKPGPKQQVSPDKAGGTTGTSPPTLGVFTIGGFDFQKLMRCDEAVLLWNGSAAKRGRDHPCLRILIGGEEQLPLAEKMKFKVHSDNTATFSLPGGTLTKAKSISFQLAGSSKLETLLPVEWVVPLPKTEVVGTPGPTPSYLRVGDSVTVSFPGANLAQVDAVTFDRKIALVKNYNSDKAALEIVVTTDVTNLPGRKELTASVNGKSIAGLQIEVIGTKQ